MALDLPQGGIFEFHVNFAIENYRFRYSDISNLGAHSGGEDPRKRLYN